jgi:hypothetical protein
MLRRLSVLHVLLLACVVWLCVAGVGFVLRSGGTSAAQGEGGRQEIRLRSFAPGATGRLSVLRGAAGAWRVRLTVLRLPPPQVLDARARVYIVWAVAGGVGGGGRVFNLGTVERDRQGNGGLEFVSPGALERYSVMVTAEVNAQATGPLGPPVLTTRAGEVFAGGAGRADFYSEVDDALGAGETRTLTLIGDGIAPRARGTASVTTRNGKTFVRARIRKLPLPSAVGADIYALWARAPDGRIAYLGSLPSNVNNTEIYVRAGLAFRAFELFVTAENRRPSIFPSSRSVLRTSAVRRSTRRRFRRRMRIRRLRMGQASG